MSEFRALLLTDVVDSTKLSEAIGDQAMAEVWVGHDRVARDLLPGFHGLEIDKTDGMLLMFEHAKEAVAYALAYHHALASLPVPLKARAGLHVGPVILRENLPEDVARGAKPIEVDGMAKPTAARVMSTARGGQTLLTVEAKEDLGQTELKLQSHGFWQIKGVEDPLELFEVGRIGERFIAPPDGDKVFRVVRAGEWWLPVRDIPNNLPHQTTSFIGRERELDEVKALLAKSRLITLLGMGGLGKTRLSLQAAAEVISQFPDGVWFLDLAPIRDAALVVGEAAQVLNVREEPGRPLIQTLCAHIKTQRMLFVVDNCEHLVHASAELAAAILKAAPYVRMITSSREALRVPGEHAYPIAPLPVPGKNDSLETLAGMTAVRLFVERAQQHKPSFELNAREAPAVAELVTRLEGIPLALELAAARVRSLSVADINARLKDRYKILTGGARVLQERQQTLRALVDWSYELLTPDEQLGLERLGIFVGGFDLAAAEAIGGADPLDPLDMLDLLASLVEKSLITMVEREEGTRYRMLVTIREYALEKLAARGEAESTAAHHCEHYFVMAKEAGRGLNGPEQAEWTRRVEDELDNIRGALALALNGGVDPVISVKIAVAMQGFWTLRGYAAEGRTAVRSALALPSIQASANAQAWGLYVGAALATSQSDHVEARRMLETCLELRRGLGNSVDIAATLSTLSLARLQSGDAAGAAVGEEEALQIFRQMGDRYGEAIGLLHLGQIGLFRGDDAQARQQLDQGLAIAREIKQQEIQAECELVLGKIAFDAGEMPGAMARFNRSLTVSREAADKRGEANALWWLGETDMLGGNLASARSRMGDALQAFRAFDMSEELFDCLEAHAVMALLEGRADSAVPIAAAAAVARQRLGLVRSPSAEQRGQANLARLRDAMDASSFEAAWAEGSTWEIERAVRGALSTPAEVSPAVANQT